MRVLYIFLFLFFFFQSPLFSQSNPDVQEVQEKVHKPKYGYIGIGMGMPYGWNGINFELPVFEKLYLSTGAGLMLNPADNWAVLAHDINIGPSLHFPTTGVYDPAIRLLYGKIGFPVDANSNRMTGNKIYKGWTLGLSNNFLFGRKKAHGFSVDFLYIVHSDLLKPGDKLPPGERFKLGFGYKHRFSLR